MFSWLWQWSRPKAAPAAARANTTTNTATRVRAVAVEEAPAERESLLQELAREAELMPPLAPEEEDRVTSLVVQVVEHVCRRKVDPPVMPALVPRVLAVVGEPEVDIVKLARLIEQDLAISAKLLSVANSAAFGGSKEVSTVRDAINYLGTEQVAQVAIGLACASQYEQESRDRGSPFRARWERLFQHGMSSAFSASHLASKVDRRLAEQAFLGGLFHDVGKAVALRAIEALARGGKLPETNELIIDEALHRIHAYPGAEFYDKWTLPGPLMTICAEHHQQEELTDASRALHCVVVASSFDALHYGSPTERRDALLELSISAQQLGLSDAQLRACHAQAAMLGQRTQRTFKS